ncbi:serine/threonine protein kinase, CMGC, CDC2/CDK sub [Bulinus truncatus]|nr:serine/threonine protein kinase, CMGC, CDC2/CDK sub [Bulinus truncatus]
MAEWCRYSTVDLRVLGSIPGGEAHGIFPGNPIGLLHPAPYQYPHMGFALQYPLQRTFEVIQQLGSGSYGEVFLACDIRTGESLAVKKLRIADGLSEDVVDRECNILKMLNHRNIIKLKDVCNMIGQAHEPRTSLLVFELCFCDLWSMLISDQVHLTLPNIKSISQQILEGLHYIHSHRIIHRDLKLSNILITTDGVVKIADFGMARFECPSRFYSPNIATLHYRSPELLLGSTNYGPAVDVWSLGCIIVELFSRTRFILGDTEHAQLLCIIGLLGTMDRSKMPADLDLPYLDSLLLPANPQGNIQHILRQAVRNSDAVDMLLSMLEMNPDSRPSCAASLSHPFFIHRPQPLAVKLENRNNQPASVENNEQEVTSSTDISNNATPPAPQPEPVHPFAAPPFSHHFIGDPRLLYQPHLRSILPHFFYPYK